MHSIKRHAVILALVLTTIPGTLSGVVTLPGWDDTGVSFSHAGAVAFHTGPGSMEVSDLACSAMPAHLLEYGNGLAMIPIIDFRATELRFDRIPTSIIDDTLRTISVFPVTINLSALCLSQNDGSPWIHGIWARAQLVSDLREVGTEDFSFEAAGFSGYRFTDRLTVGAGVEVGHLAGEMEIHPGIGIDWRIRNDLRLEILGTRGKLAFTPDENWEFAIRGDQTGETWNLLDKGGETLSLGLGSYRLGLFASRRLAGELWLGVGAGATFGNRIQLKDRQGEFIVKEGLENGLFGQVSLTIKSW